MVDVGERHEMGKSFCFRHVPSCMMRSRSVSYHDDVSANSTTKSAFKELYNCRGRDDAWDGYWQVGGEVNIVSCKVERGKENDKESCGFWDAHTRNPRVNRIMTSTYYVTNINVFIKRNILLLFGVRLCVFWVGLLCGCAAANRPQAAGAGGWGYD